jgi:hypothetical protein
LKEDKKQNPHLYKKNAKTSEINKDNREKLDKDGVSILILNSSSVIIKEEDVISFPEAKQSC